MPIELQTRLLRVLAEGSFYRVGGAQPVRVDVRIVAATHQPLEQRVEQGLFREDLFHRLNVIRLRLPPLRERTEDIPALANHFLTASARALGVPVKRLTPEALAVLTRFDFPGNVRQLENFCHWLTVMAPGQTVEPADLPPEIRAVDSQQASGAPATQRRPWPPSARCCRPRCRRRPSRMRRRRATGRILVARRAASAGARRACRHGHADAPVREDPAAKRAGCQPWPTVEAATRLGIGRNTITRKLRELGIEDD